MKVKICPIDGNKLDETNELNTLIRFGDISDLLCGDESFCAECGKRIIPLVTPQEEK